MLSCYGDLPILKGRLSRAKDVLMDRLDDLLGRRSWDTPPRRLMFVGEGNFSRAGERYLHFFVDACGLGPDAKVLDAGCGVGRMAIPLTRYLSPRGEYRGFDIVGPGIKWCRQNITSRFPNFQFEWADIHNKTYNPNGKTAAANFRFPYEEERFDFIFLTSVFTHMLRADVENYLTEIKRVLKPGGRCVASFFLLNDESRTLISRGESRLEFRHDLGGCWSTDPLRPESAVAFDERAVVSMYDASGLEIKGPIRTGSWCGRKSSIRFQDVIVAGRRAE